MVKFQFPIEIFNSIAAGDLIFFSRQTNSSSDATATDFEVAVAACGGNIFHVAIVTGIEEKCDLKLIEATTKEGVNVFPRIN